MARTILVTLAGGALALGGLVLAAGNAPGALQTLGLWILVLAWIALVGYHGARAERQEQRARLASRAPPAIRGSLARKDCRARRATSAHGAHPQEGRWGIQDLMDPPACKAAKDRKENEVTLGRKAELDSVATQGRTA